MVDPAPINAAGFRFDFDEAVTGTIKLTDEAGADLNWTPNVGGQTATLTAVAGQKSPTRQPIRLKLMFKMALAMQLQQRLPSVTKPKE